MPTRTLLLLAILLLVAAACGDSTDTDSGASDEGGASSLVTEVDTELGTVLATTGGLTLYGFLPDGEAGEPTCTGGCAETWPVLTVPDGELPDGMDAATFSVTEHPEAGPQLQAGDWPLYTFASDQAEGDVTGQGVGDNWFAVAPDGTLIGADESAAREDATGAGPAGPGYDRGY